LIFLDLLAFEGVEMKGIKKPGNPRFPKGGIDKFSPT